MAFTPSSHLSAFDSDDRASFFSAAVSPAVTQNPPGSGEIDQLPHTRLRKKLFGSKWRSPTLKDTFWLFNTLRDSESGERGILDGPALIQGLRKIQQLAGLRDESLLALIDAPAFNYNTSSEMYVRWPAVLREATIATDEVDTIVASLRQQAAAETAVNHNYRFQFQQECQALSREGAAPFTPKSLRRHLRDALHLKATSRQAEAVIQDITDRGNSREEDTDAAAAFGGVASSADVGLWLQSYVEDAVAEQAALAAAEAGTPVPLHDVPAQQGSQSRAGHPICDLRVARGSSGCALLAQHGYTPVPGIVVSSLQSDKRDIPSSTVADLLNSSSSHALDHSSTSDGVLSISSLSLPSLHRQDAAAVAVSLNYQAYGDALYLYRKTQNSAPGVRRAVGDDAPDVCDILLSDSADDPDAAGAGFQLLAEESTNEGAELTPKRYLLLRRQSAVASRHVPPVLVDVVTVVYNGSADGSAPQGNNASATGASADTAHIRHVHETIQAHADVDGVLTREGYCRVAGNCNEGNPGPEIAVWFRRQYALPENAEANTDHDIVMQQRKQDGVLALSLAMRRLTMALLLWEAENVCGKGGKGGNVFNVGNGRGVLTAQLALRQAFNQAVRRLGAPAGHISDAALVAMLTGEAPYLVSPVPELPLGVSADVPAGHLSLGLSSAAAVDAVAALDPRGEDIVQRRVFAERALWGWGPARTGDLPATAAALTYTVLLTALGSRLAEGWSLSGLVRFARGWVDMGSIRSTALDGQQTAGKAELEGDSTAPVSDNAPSNGQQPADDDVFSSDGVSDSDSESGDEGEGGDKEQEAPLAEVEAPPSHTTRACRFPPATSFSDDSTHDDGSVGERLHLDELLKVLGSGSKQEEPAAHPCAVAGVARETDSLPGAATGHRVVDVLDCLWMLGVAAVHAWQSTVASASSGHACRPSEVHVQWGALLVQIGTQEAQRTGMWKSLESTVHAISQHGDVWGVQDPPLDDAGRLDAHVVSHAMRGWALHAPAWEVFPRACVFAVLPLMGLGSQSGAAIGMGGWHLVLEADVLAHTVCAAAVDARARSASVLLRAGLLSFAQQRELLWCAVRPRQTISSNVAPTDAGDVLLDITALLHAMLYNRLHEVALDGSQGVAAAPADTDAEASASSESGSESDSESDATPKSTQKDSTKQLEGVASSLPGRLPFAAEDTSTLLLAQASELLLQEALRAFTAGTPPPPQLTNAPKTRAQTSNLLAAGSSLWGAIGSAAPASQAAHAGGAGTGGAAGGEPTLRLGEELASSSGGVRDQASSAAWAAGVQLQSRLASSADGASMVGMPALGGVERALLHAQVHSAAVLWGAQPAVEAWLQPCVAATMHSTASTSSSSSAAGVAPRPDIFATGAGAAGAGVCLPAPSPVSIWGDGTPSGTDAPPKASGDAPSNAAAEEQNTRGQVIETRAIPCGCVLPSAFVSLLAPRTSPDVALPEGTVLLESQLPLGAAAAPAPHKRSRKHKRRRKAKKSAVAHQPVAPATEEQLASGMSRAAVARRMLLPCGAALQMVGSAVAAGCLAPLDKGMLAAGSSCTVTQQMQLCVTAVDQGDTPPDPLQWLAGAPLIQQGGALRGAQTSLRRTGADASAGMASAIMSYLSAVVPVADAVSVDNAVSVPDLLAMVRGAQPLLGLGLWPVSRWLPALQQGMFKACCKNALYVCTEEEWGAAVAAAEGAASPPPDTASSESDEGHVKGVILGGSSSEEEGKVDDKAGSDESGVISSSGESDVSDGASSDGSGASSVSGHTPAADSSSESDGPRANTEVAADCVLSSLHRVSGSTALRKVRKDAAQLLLPSAPVAALESQSSLRRKRKAMQSDGDIVQPRGDGSASHCLSAHVLSPDALVQEGGELVHQVELLPPAADKGQTAQLQKTLKKRGFIEAVKLPARTGSLWLRCVQVAAGVRAVRKAQRRAGGKGDAAAAAMQEAADKWGKAAAKAMRYAQSDAVLTQQLHSRRAKNGSSSRPPSVPGGEAAAKYGHIAPDELKRQHSTDGSAWIDPGTGGDWVCVGGWRVNADELPDRNKSVSSVLWMRCGNKGRDKSELGKALSDAALAAAGPPPSESGSSKAPSSSSDTSGSELPGDDALVAVPQSALLDEDRVVPSLSNPSSHLPVPADAWGSQLVPKSLRRLLPRCQRRYHRLFAAGSVPLNPLSVFVPEDRDGSGTLPPATFGEVLRSKLQGLGLRGEAELSELLRALQHASCLGQERTGEKRRVSRSTHIDYVLFSRLLMSPESQALGVVVAARVRVGLLAHSRAKALGQRASKGTVRDVLQQYADEESAGNTGLQHHSAAAGQGLRGRISLGSLARALQTLGIAVSASHMVPLCRALGLTPDSSGSLDVDTFVRVVMAGTGVVPWTQGGVSLLSPAARAARTRLREAAWISASSDLDVATAFRAVDPRGRGVLGPGELKQALAMLGVTLAGSDFDALMAALDGNGSGKIGFSEFVRLLELDGGELAATHRLLHSHLVASAAEGDNALARVRAAYSAFDCDEVGTDIGAGAGSGSIPLRAFVAATRTAGLPLTPMATVLLARRFALPGTRSVDEGRGGYTSGALGFDVSYARFLAWAFGQSPHDIMAVSDSALGAAAGGPMAGLAEAHDAAAPPAAPDVWRSVRTVAGTDGRVPPPAVGGAGGGSSDEDGPVGEKQLRQWLQNAMHGQAKDGSAPDGSPSVRGGAGGALQSPPAASRLRRTVAGAGVQGMRATFEDTQAAAASAAMAADAPGSLTPRTLRRLQGIGDAGVPEARSMALKHMAPRRRAAFLIEAERQERWKKSGVWVCKTCSYQNTDYARKCFMCLSSCPHSTTSAAEEWNAPSEGHGTAADDEEEGSVSKDLSGIMDAAGHASGRRAWQYGESMRAAAADPLGAFQHSPRRDVDSAANSGLQVWHDIAARGLDRDLPRRTRPVGSGGAAFNGHTPSAGPGQLLEAAGHNARDNTEGAHGQRSQHARQSYIGTPMGRYGHGPYSRPEAPYAEDTKRDGFADWAHASAASLPSQVGPSSSYGIRQQSVDDTPMQALPSSFPVHRRDSGRPPLDRAGPSNWPRNAPVERRGNAQAHSYGIDMGAYPRTESSAASVDDWGSNFGPGAERLAGGARARSDDPATMDPLRASGHQLAALAGRGRAASVAGTPMTPSRGSMDLSASIGRSTAGHEQGALGWHALASGPYMDAPPAALGGTPSAARAALGSSMGLGSPGSSSRGVRPDYMAMAAASSLRDRDRTTKAQAATDFATGAAPLPPRHASLHRKSDSFFD